MIVQQVNLYQERFREKKIWLSGGQMLMLGMVLLSALVASSYWYQQQFDAAEFQHQSYQKQQQQATAQLQGVRNQLQKLLADDQLERTITHVSEAISVRKQLIQFMQENRFGGDEGFSRYLSGLSEISADDVWLNEITLSRNNIKLSGSALKAELIPGYFSSLKQSRMFSGRQFDVFEVNRQAKRQWKVDFQIASKAPQHE